MLFNSNNITIDELENEWLKKRGVKLKVLRLDKMHPVVSGNKLFKLHYFLETALRQGHKTIETFGGAYSNHLVAAAFACRELNLGCRGIVRSEAPAVLSPTLQACIHLGMQLQFVSREEYAGLSQQTACSGGKTIIPEGGYHVLGAKGAALIPELLNGIPFTHICTATGTATTLAGLLLRAGNLQKVIAVPVLKGFKDIPQRLKLLTGTADFKNLVIFDDYHFGGYAKKTKELIDFMNAVYREYQLPTDFVYTGKMMFGVLDQVNKGFFPEGSVIICLHTGGLQGNASLPAGTLIF
jgi:1-aminocyclopropane-1-carboxylate deaminase